MTDDQRLLQFVRSVTFGHGSYGSECRICLADDYGGKLEHLPWCEGVRARITELVDGEKPQRKDNP